MKTIGYIVRALYKKFDDWQARSGTFFVDQLSDEELALFHDPERP